LKEHVSYVLLVLNPPFAHMATVKDHPTLKQIATQLATAS